MESFQRIQAYLSAESKLDDRVTLYQGHLMAPSPVNKGSKIRISLELQPSRADTPAVSNADLVHIHQADFAWQRQSIATLSNVNIHISPSSFTAVTGPVGSGKSTLLKAILGEVPCLSGFIHINVAKIAFCDTKTWIRNRSIRDNICHPLPYDEEWYRTVIYSTALDYDINALPQKDHTVIGSNGMSMSGGQRQRITIARAVYARTKVAIFDDALSALDAATAAQVFTHIFGWQGILRRNGVAVILATHNWNHLAYADHAIVLSEGKIWEQVPPRELKTFKDRLLGDATTGQVSSQKLPEAVQENQISGCPAGSDEGSARKLGDLSDYVYYFRASGGWSMILYAGALTIGVFCSQFTSKCTTGPYIIIRPTNMPR